MKYFDLLNEAFDKMLNEAKQDEINFANVFGTELKDRFLAQKQRMQAPEKDFYYWIRKSRENLEGTVQELDSFLTELENKLTKKQRTEIAEAGAELVFEDNDWKVYHITTYDAAVKYGSHTKWCITGRYPGYRNENDGKRFFDRYLAQDYKGYYFFIRKDGSDIKYAVCPRQGGGWDIWTPTDGRYDELPGGPEDLSEVPDLKGLPVSPDFEEEDLFEPEDAEAEEGDDEDFEEPEWGEEEGEPEPEPEPTEWEDEHGEIHQGRRPEDPEDPVIINIENPNAMEFEAASREEAVRKFAEAGFEGAEIVADLAPNLFAVHFMAEPEHQEFELEGGETYSRDLPGDRYTAFVFMPGQGGGPLMGQMRDGFAIIAFRSLEKLQQQFGGQRGAQIDIRNNRDETADMPECLQENFYYYDDGSWMID